QAQFKTSFYAAAEWLNEVVAAVGDRLRQSKMPRQIISSVDPITGIGMIDLLPVGVSKAFALDWLCREQNLSPQAVIFAGDSGNDLEAFNAGYRTIIVGNAPTPIVESVQRTHCAAGWTDRLFHASQHATSGVLEGVLHYASGSTD
ncbi:MAG: HAD-IIB family hydrolase, partial [Planctomycetota bacterium]|nr:HAD-IIB family hydrolase [Planctomycetota bacterium]